LMNTPPIDHPRRSFRAKPLMTVTILACRGPPSWPPAGPGWGGRRADQHLGGGDALALPGLSAW